jgi:hypothetical protein
VKVWSYRIVIKLDTPVRHAYGVNAGSMCYARTIGVARRTAAGETATGGRVATIYHRTAKGEEVVARYRNGEED